jgi:hypothetical protein
MPEIGTSGARGFANALVTGRLVALLPLPPDPVFAASSFSRRDALPACAIAQIDIEGSCRRLVPALLRLPT